LTRNPRNPAKGLIDAGTEILREEAERDWAKSERAAQKKRRATTQPARKSKSK
jgi:hypothetical protein